MRREPATDYTEDKLVQEPTAELLEKELGWRSVMAWNQEEFGVRGAPYLIIRVLVWCGWNS